MGGSTMGNSFFARFKLRERLEPVQVMRIQLVLATRHQQNILDIGALTAYQNSFPIALWLHSRETRTFYLLNPTPTWKKLMRLQPAVARI
jgi:hypothetical protein